MTGTELFEIPPAPENPVEYAATLRNEPILDTVRRAINNRHVMLAYQPVMYANDSTKPAFHEGLIRVLDQFQEVGVALRKSESLKYLEQSHCCGCPQRYTLEMRPTHKRHTYKPPNHSTASRLVGTVQTASQRTVN